MSEPVAQPVRPAHTEAAAPSTNGPSPDAPAGDARIDTAQLLQVGRRDEPVEDAAEEAAEASKLSQSYASISATLGILGLVGGLFVMWMVPFSIGAVVFAEFARRQGDRHWPVRLGYVSGIVGIVFGGVWVIYTLGLLTN